MGNVWTVWRSGLSPRISSNPGHCLQGAELCAMWQALRFCEHQGERKFVIYKDTLNVLLALDGHNGSFIATNSGAMLCGRRHSLIFYFCLVPGL